MAIVVPVQANDKREQETIQKNQNTSKQEQSNAVVIAKLTQQLEDQLPAVFKDGAYDLAKVLVADGVIDISQVPPQLLESFKRFASLQNDQTSRKNPNDLQPESLFQREKKSYEPSLGLKLLSASYVLFRKLHTFYSYDAKGKIYAGLTFTDYLVRAAAGLVAIDFQRKKCMPEVEALLARAVIRSQIEKKKEFLTPGEAMQLSSIIRDAIGTVIGVMSDPNFVEKTLSVPTQLALQLGSPVAYHAVKGFLASKQWIENNKSAYKVPRKISSNDGSTYTLDGQDYTVKDEDKKYFHGNVFVAKKETSSDIRNYKPYKDGVKNATKLLVKKSLGVVDKIVQSGVSEKTIANIENKTLGVVSRTMVADIAKEVITPFVLRQAAKELKKNQTSRLGKAVKKVFPHYTKLDLKMHGQKRKIKIKGTDGKEEEVEVYDSISNKAFVGKSIGRYVVRTVGANGIIKLLNFMIDKRKKITGAAYSVMHKMAQLPVKMGITKTNIVQALNNKIREKRILYLAQNPGRMAQIISGNMAITREKQQRNRMIELQGLQNEFGSIVGRMQELYQAKATRNIDLTRALSNEVQVRLVGLARHIDDGGYVGRAFDFVLKNTFTQEYSIVRPWVQLFGAWSMNKIGERIGIA